MNFAPGLRIFFSVALFAASTATAQDEPRQALDAANAVYNSGDYAGAVAAYEKFLADYPTSPIVANAQIQLAESYFLTGENQKCLDALAKFFSGPPPPKELAERAAFLEPQALSGLASSLKPEDPQRKANYASAVQKFADFVQKYPQSQDIEAANYGSAIASFQSGDYAAAKSMLEANIKRFGSSPSIQDSQNLLALTLATEGSRMLAAEGGDKNAAFALYAQAADLLRGIIKQRTDLTLVNAAQFQLGEILLSEAAFAPEDRKPALLAEARNAFRGVLPKETVVALQQKKIESLPALRRAALAARNQPEQRRLERQAQREQIKLAELQSRPDQTLTALQKVAESYFQQGQYDESRVVLSHISPLLGDAEDKKRNLYFLAMT
jgi:outer membrane protein assembly factor BamD (BamD/ComL family)